MNPIHIDIEVINYQGSANTGVESLGIFFIFYVDICILCWQHRCRVACYEILFYIICEMNVRTACLRTWRYFHHFLRNIVNIHDIFFVPIQ